MGEKVEIELNFDIENYFDKDNISEFQGFVRYVNFQNTQI